MKTIGFPKEKHKAPKGKVWVKTDLIDWQGNNRLALVPAPHASKLVEDVQAQHELGVVFQVFSK